MQPHLRLFLCLRLRAMRKHGSRRLDVERGRAPAVCTKFLALLLAGCLVELATLGFGVLFETICCILGLVSEGRGLFGIVLALAGETLCFAQGGLALGVTAWTALAWQELLVGADGEEVLAMTTATDDTAAGRLCLSARLERAFGTREEGFEVACDARGTASKRVRGEGLGAVSAQRDGTLLEGEQVLVGILQRRSDVLLEQVLDGRVEVRADERLEEKVGDGTTGLVDPEVELVQVHLDLPDLEEALAVRVGCAVQIDGEAESLCTAQLDVEESRVLGGEPAGLAVEVEGNVLGFDAESLDAEGDRAVKVGSKGSVALLERELVLVGEVYQVWNERSTGRREVRVVDDNVEVLAGVLDAVGRMRENNLPGQTSLTSFLFTG